MVYEPAYWNEKANPNKIGICSYDFSDVCSWMNKFRDEDSEGRVIRRDVQNVNTILDGQKQKKFKKTGIPVLYPRERPEFDGSEYKMIYQANLEA